MRSTSRTGGCCNGCSSCAQNVASTALTGDVCSIAAGALKERLKLGFTISLHQGNQKKKNSTIF